MRVTFEIPIGGKRRLRKAVAQSGIRRAQAALSRETEAILLEAADAAMETRYWQELLQWRIRLAEIAAEKAMLARSRFDNRARELHIADAVKAECDAVDAEEQRLEARSGLAAARQRLSRALGMSPACLLEITGVIEIDDGPLMSLDSVLAIARSNCPQLSEACAALSESRQTNRLACAERFPNPTLGPRVRDRLGEADDEVGARFAVDLPLFDRNQGRIRESAAEVHASRARVVEAECEALGSIAEAYLELQALHGALATHKSRITEQIERYEALLNDPAIQRGMTTIQALEIRQRLLQTRIKHLELRHRYLRLRTQLELTLGVSICSPNQTSPSAESPSGW
jgi:cobalt-zinc-cadmium efflux system outer membrane protein